MKILHQSWGVVALAVGIIAGVVVGLIFRVNYFASEWWVVLVVVMFVIMYLKPQVFTVGMMFVAGMVLAFFRVAAVLPSGEKADIQGIAMMDETVTSARDWFAERIMSLIPEPEVKLGMSYLLGMKSGLTSNLSEQLRVVGLTHIVVASGAHLSILVEVARKVFGKVSRFTGSVVAGMFIIFFMSMVGWTPSILRAGVMALLTITAGYSGRKIAPVRIILLVAAFTLVLDPRFILNLGWMLSFASYAGIMLLGPKLQNFFTEKRSRNLLAEWCSRR